MIDPLQELPDPGVLISMPYSHEAEKGLLGSVLQMPREVLDELAGRVSQAMFYVEAHRIIFGIVSDLCDSGKVVDPITLQQEITDRGLIDNIGGPSYIAELYVFVPTSAHWEHYSDIIRDKAALRDIIITCKDTVKECFSGNQGMEILDKIESRLSDINDSQDVAGEIPTPKEAAMELFDEMHKKLESRGELVGIPTRWSWMDNLTGGWQTGLHIVGARPSVGKTVVLCNIASNAAVNHKKNVLFISLEMGRTKVLSRCIADLSNLNFSKLKNGMGSINENRKFAQGIESITKSTLWIDDRKDMDILEIRARVRKLNRKIGLDLVLVDYLQLASASSDTARRDDRKRCSDTSRGLKHLSEELKIPIIAAAQLSRDHERAQRPPRESDIEWCSQIEQDADTITLMHPDRQEDEDEDHDKRFRTVYFNLIKHRDGPVGEEQMNLNKIWQRFEELEN